MRPLKVLVGCEKSGTVRDAFNALGHDAWSCDIQAADTPSNRHMQVDVREALRWGVWDIFIVTHPPCTRLCNSGVRWLTAPPKDKTLADMWMGLHEGAALFSDCWQADVKHVAVENPIMHKYAKALIRGYEPPACMVHPWQFAKTKASVDYEKKRTCWWLRDLPALVPTTTLDGTDARQSTWLANPGPDRGDRRSKFFPGMADAMAVQWSEHVLRSEWELAA